MKQLTIFRLPDPIKNDNIQDAFEYVRKLDPQMIDVLNWENDFPYRPDVCFRLAYNSYAFYFYVEVKEKYIRANASQNNGQVWLDSCVEFFLSPEGNKDYYNLEMNCIGTKLLGFRKWQEDPVHAPDEMLALIHAKSSLGDTPFEEKSGDFSWNMEVVIPFKAYWKHSIQAEKGLSMRANFYKCGDELQEPHFLSWNPVRNPSPSFHQPDYFGEIILE